MILYSYYIATRNKETLTLSLKTNIGASLDYLDEEVIYALCVV